MPRTPPPPFTIAELDGFVRTRSDFGFEMQALSALNGQGYACRHAATFVDPITSKIREFDIRARRGADGIGIRLAVECQNLTMDSPLILHRTPRGPHEATHSAAVFKPGHTYSFWQSRTLSPSDLYPLDQPVGRQLEQPKKKDDGTLSQNDGPTFEKWSQALSGVHDELVKLVGGSQDGLTAYLILPVLVIPEGTLFAVDYDAGGSIVTPLRVVPKAELFVGHTWTVPAGLNNIQMQFSHLEILTLPELGQWSRGLIENRALFPSI